MQYLEKELVEVVGSVWQTVLSFPFKRAERSAHGADRLITACVQITGAWFGAFTLQCSYSLAQRIAVAMFDLQSGSVSVRDIRDALAELANIAGGNVKALLPPPCYLSLPVVIDGMEYTLLVPGGKDLSSLDFECDGEPLRVTLLQCNGPSARALQYSADPQPECRRP
jgi:chemotaxis protein CheX